MKMTTAKLLLSVLFIGISILINAQCANNNTFLMNATPPASPGISSMTVNCMNGGQYVTVNVTAGVTYTFATCGNTAFDTQLTIYNAAGGAFVAYNDDGCGVQSTITWVATFTGSVNVVLDQYPCLNTGTCTDLTITATPPVQNGTGCNTNTTICTQGIAGPFGFSTPGPPVSTCLDFFGPNYAYIVLYITQSGPLQMLIDGNAATGFLDVAVFNVPSGVDPCVASLSTANQISCNYASSSSGCNQIGTAFPCPSSVPAPNVVAGQVLFIVVENWSGTSTNFTLDLANPPAAQTGPPVGTVNPAGPFCTSAAPVQLTAVNSGGTWSGPGVSPSGMFTPSSVGPGSYVINYAIGSAPCQGSGSTTIVVTNAPTVNAVTNQVLCANTATTAINFSGSVVGATYSWINSNTAIGLGASGSGNIPSFTATNTTASPITATITVTPSVGGCAGTPITFTITVNPRPTVNAVANQTRCANTATTAINFSGSMGTATYNWTNSNTAIGLGATGTGNIPSFTATNSTSSPITSTITVTPTANGCLGTPITFTITVNPTPTVSPVANQVLCATTATTAINFSGPVAGTTYAWSNNNTAIGLGASGTGNIASFTATNATSSPITSTITVTPTANGCMGTPITFTITVNPRPTVNAVANQVLCANTATTAVNFSGSMGTATYNWINSNTAIGLGASGSGNIPSFTATNATAGPITSTITVTPTANGCTGTPITFTITVNPASNPSFTTTNFCQGAASPAATVTGVAGGSFSFNPSPGGGVTINPVTGSITGGIGGTTYTVQYTTSGACPQSSTQPVTVYALPNVVANDVSVCLGGTVAITASGAATYSWNNGLGAGQTHNVSPAITTSYIVTGTSANGCVATDIMTVTVLASAPISAGPDVTICNGASTTLIASGGATYTWLAPISAAGASQTVSPTTTTTYTVNGTDASGCTGSDQVVVTVNPVPTVTPVADQTLCANSNTTAINFTGAVLGTTYNWINTNATIGLGASGSGNIGAFSATNAGSTPQLATITVTPTANGCAGTPDVFTITVNPVPTITAVADQVLCANTNTTAVNFTGSVAGTTYNWVNTNTTIGLGASGSGNIGAFSATNAGSTPQVATITVTPTVGGCSGTPDVFTITVNPIPTVTPVADQVLCANTNTTAVNFTGSVAGTTYNWLNTNTAIGLGASGSGNIGAFSATNSGSTTQVATITVTPTINGCAGTPDVFTITVNPIPTVTAVADQVLCANASTTAINFTGSMAGATYNWTNTNTSIGLTATGAGNISSFTATNAGATTQVATITVTPTANGCVGVPDVFTITVNPLPTAVISGTASVCVGGTSPTITFTGANGAAPYTFSYNINGGATQTITSVGNTATITVPSGTVGTYNYNLLSVQSAAPSLCSQTQVGTATITVNPSPTPVINGAAQYCSGGFSTLSTTVPYSSYSWSTGPSTPTVNVTAVNNPITVTVTNAQGCSGTSAVFTVVENNVITYNSTVTICQGASTTIHGNTQSVAGIYTQTFMLPTGCDSVSNVTLVVNPLPTINGGPNQTACLGTPVTLNAVGAPTMVWNNGGVNGVPFTQAVGTVTYTATGTDANGCVNTDQVDVTINPPANVDPIANQTHCNGVNSAAVNFTGTVPGTTYTWTNSNPSIGLGASGSGNIGSFALTNAGTTPQVATITVTPTANGCVGPTGQFTITVNPTPSIAGPLINQLFCNGSPTGVMTFSSPVAGTTYTWVNPNTSIGLGTSGTGNIGSFIATNTGSLSNVAIITITPTANTCVGPTSQFLITVNPTATVNALPNETLCNNSATTAVNFGSPVAGTTYSWTNSNTSIGLGASGNGNIASFNATNATGSPIVGTITITPTAFGCTGSTGQYTITVNPTPSVNAVSNQTLCSGANTNAVNLSGSSAGITYNWTNTNTSIGLGAAGSGDIASFVANNAGATPQVASITVSPTQNGCIGASQIFTITVNPIPTVNALVDETLCAGSNTTAINFSGSSATATYDWTNTNTGIGLAASGTGNIQSFVATNATASPISGTITVTPTENGCVGTTNSAVITVNPLPTGTISGTTAVCIGGPSPTITFTGSNGVAPYTFTYNVNNTGSQTVTSVGNTATITVPTVLAGVFNVNLVSVQDASVTGCVQTQAGVATITVNALPVVFAGNDFSICESDQAILTASGANTYAWDQGVVNGVAFTPASSGTYTVTGTDANGCVNTDDVTVTIELAPVVSFFGDNLAGCAPLTVTFTNTTPGALTNCIWTLENGTTLNGCGTVTTTFNSPGTFDVTLTTTSATGCSASATYTDYIYVEADPIASFTPSATSVSNFEPLVTFDNTSSGAINYDWDFGDGSQINHEVSPSYAFPGSGPGTYEVELIAYSPLGCVDIAYATIQVTEDLLFYVPNTFTPDDDDYNPVFQPVFTSGYDPYDFNLFIFDRWGEIIFESHNAAIGWDGTYGGEPTQDGTYTWKIEFKVTENDERKVVLGHVNLMR